MHSSINHYTNAMLQVGPVHIDLHLLILSLRLYWLHVDCIHKKTHERTGAHHPKWPGNSAGKYQDPMRAEAPSALMGSYKYTYHEYAHLIYNCCIPKG